MRLLLLLLLLTPTVAFADLYTWKDSSGVSHYTNLPDSIPLKYRKKAKVIAMPGDQKANQTAGQNPVPSSSPSATPAVALPMPPPPPEAVPSQPKEAQGRTAKERNRPRRSSATRTPSQD